MASLGGGLLGSYLFNNLRSTSLFIGAGSAFAYNWLSDNFAYNRDAWMTDIALMQAHGFQKDNMDVAVHSMARDAIRDRQTSASTQLSNNILSSTLFLAMAMDILVSGTLPDHCDDFVINLYMIALGSGIIYLILAICAAVSAILIMYTTSSEILTANLDDLWTRLDNKMSTYGQLLTAEFEHRKAKDMFTPPMAKMVVHKFKPASYIASICGMNSTARRAISDTQPPRSVSQEVAEQQAACVERSTEQENRADDKMPEASDRLHAIILSYRDAWIEREPLWLPVQTHSRLLAVLGVKSLLDAWGYFTLAKYYGPQSSAWALWLGQIIFVFLNVALVPVLLSVGVGARFQFTTSVSMMIAPLLALTAAVTCSAWIDDICIPGCYLTHFLLNLQGLLTYGGPKRQVEQAAEEHFNRKRSMQRLRSGDATGGRVPDTDVQETSASSPPKEPETECLDEVEQRAENVVLVQMYLKNILRASRYTITFLWGMAVFWSLYKMLNGSSFRNAKAPLCFYSSPGLEIHATETLHVTWPSPFFHAHVLTSSHRGSSMGHLSLIQRRGVKMVSESLTNASARAQADARLAERVFVADRFRVFEVTANLTVRHYPCESNDAIGDVAVACNSSSCALRALLHAENPTILNCETGDSHPLLQAPNAPARRFTALSMGTLLVTHGNDVVQYDWSASRKAWVPSLTVVESGNSAANASDSFEMPVAATDNRVFLIRTKSKLEAIDLATGQHCGSWSLPDGVVGVAAQNSSSILLLVRGLSDQQELKPSRLMRMQIENTHCNKSGRAHSSILQKALALDA